MRGKFRKITNIICDLLGDLVSLVQFRKHEKHPLRSATFSKVALLKVTLLYGCFSDFLNCTNGIKSCNASHTVIQYPYFNNTKFTFLRKPFYRTPPGNCF